MGIVESVVVKRYMLGSSWVEVEASKNQVRDGAFVFEKGHERNKVPAIIAEVCLMVEDYTGRCGVGGRDRWHGGVIVGEKIQGPEPLQFKLHVACTQSFKISTLAASQESVHC